MTTNTAVTPAARGSADLDNLLRRELKVGDPSDPAQIAQALAERYQHDARAQAIDGEARGLPFLRTPVMRIAAPAAATATSVDLEQARSDVDQDMRMLVADSLTKDIRPELEGWQQVIHRSIDEGVAAARYGLDPHQRDKAFAMRRQLGDYARLARLVGVLTPALNRAFRNLAQSLDEACSVMLVLMGESMANVGFAGGRFLLQAPYSELQARRDAVLNALRQLDGVAAMVGQGGTWPRGLRAYRQLTTVLEARGQGDLRSLMDEVELARSMDELIQLAGGNSVRGIRAIGATAWAPLARLTRFVQTTIRQVAPASPELATLHEALQLFIDGFVPAGGFRLLRIARPSVLNYGLYGPAAIRDAESRLVALVNHRGTLARELDCLTDCACDDKAVQAQIVLDKVLYDVDRAIDLYCVGDADLGLPEVRAAAYSHLIDPLLGPPASWNAAVGPLPSYLGGLPAPPVNLIPAASALHTELTAIRNLLRPEGVLNAATSPVWDSTQATYDTNLANNLAWLGGAPTALRFAQVLHDELCLQRDADQAWRPVIEQMTTGCMSADDIFGVNGCLPAIVDQALNDIATRTVGAPGGAVGAVCAQLQTLVPPHYEESLEEIVDRLTP
jgi:hypothetical protein